VHVWVDETRPRNQGASLTAWELVAAGVPHHLIVDNAGGHLMQHGQVDICIVGTDRTTASGDVCNKIGTYLKALAAHDNGAVLRGPARFHRRLDGERRGGGNSH
jgi:methylthioribose-1-phosphate isomerase